MAFVNVGIMPREKHSQMIIDIAAGKIKAPLGVKNWFSSVEAMKKHYANSNIVSTEDRDEYRLYVIENIASGRQDIKNKNTISQQALIKESKKW